jgi:hypothetical protein
MQLLGLVGQPFQGGDLEVVDGAEVDKHHPRWRPVVGGEGGDVVEHATGVGEEQSSLGPDDQQAGRPLGRHHPWMVELVEQDQQRDEHGDQHPGEHPEDQHPGQGDQPEPEVPPADGPHPPQRGKVHQTDRGDQHDGAQDRLGQVGQQPGQQGQGEHGHHGGDHLGQLRPGPGAVVDRRLGGPTARRIGLEQPAGQVGRAQGEQLPVGVDRRIVLGGEGPGGRDGLDERHQRDPGRGRQQGAHAGELGQLEPGEAAGYRTDQRHPPALQIGQPDQRDPQGHHDQGTGDPRRPAAQRQQHGKPPGGPGRRWPGWRRRAPCRAGWPRSPAPSRP